MNNKTMNKLFIHYHWYGRRNVLLLTIFLLHSLIISTSYIKCFHQIHRSSSFDGDYDETNQKTIINDQKPIEQQSEFNSIVAAAIAAAAAVANPNQVKENSSTSTITADNLHLHDGNYSFIHNDDPYSSYFLPATLYPPALDISALIPSYHQQQQLNVIDVKNKNSNQDNNNINNRNNKTIGLGRRIGELVSTSAEKASRAFKSFPKLLNDMKPSKLLGLSSSTVDTIDLLTPKHNISSISLPNSWYLPQNTWSSFAPPPISSNLFLQQPVFVRNPESSTMSATSLAPIQPSSSSKSTVELIQSNRFQNILSNKDLYTSAQTSYGSRVKSVQRDRFNNDFDSVSNDDTAPPITIDNSDNQMDTKMANEGQITTDNNDASDQQNHQHLMINDISNGHQSFDDFPSSVDHQFNHNSNNNFNNNNFNNNNNNHNHNHNSNNNHNHNHNIENNGNNFIPSSRMRRPPYPMNFRSPTTSRPQSYPLSDNEIDNTWYPTFFGPTVKPMTRLRNVSPQFFSAAGSTGEFIPFMRPSESAATFYPISTFPMAVNNMARWPSTLSYYYPQINSAVYSYGARPTPLMTSSASMIRPMTIPYFSPYYVQRYRYAPPATYSYHPSPSIVSYAPQQAPFNSLIAAASSLYPVRVPFTPIPLTYPNRIITPVPVLRHRIGLQSTTKRQDQYDSSESDEHGKKKRN